MSAPASGTGEFSDWVLMDPSATAAVLPNIIPPKFPLIHSVTSTVYNLPGCVYSVVTFVASITFRPDLSRLFSSKPPPQIIELSDRAVTTINREIDERAPLEDDDHAEASWTVISCAKRGVIYIGTGTVVGGAKIITKVVTTTVFSSVINPWIMSCERNARRCIIPLAVGVFLIKNRPLLCFMWPIGSVLRAWGIWLRKGLKQGSQSLDMTRR